MNPRENEKEYAPRVVGIAEWTPSEENLRLRIIVFCLLSSSSATKRSRVKALRDEALRVTTRID
jgi:hypothetical protein